MRKTMLAMLSASAVLVACGGEGAPELLAAAKAYLAKNDSKAAVIQLKNALQKSPDLAEARFLLGKALLDSGDAVSAIAELRRASDLDYPAVQVLPVLARALILDRQQKALIEQYAQVDLPEPAAAADLKTSIATAYASQGNVEKARASLTAAVQAVPDYPPALRMQARLLANGRQFDAALALLDKVIAAAPQDAEAWHFKGEFLLRGKNDVAGALAAYRQALGIKADDVPARASLITLLLAQRDLAAAAAEIELLRKAAPRHPQTLYFDAELAFLKKDYKRAHELTQQLVRSSPDNVKLLQLAGAVEFNMSLLPEAERSLSKAVALAPDLALARRLLAQTYLRLGQPAKALATLEPLLTQSAGDPKAVELAAEANLQTGDLRRAEANFAKAAELDPHDVKSRVALALARLNKGDASTAMAELESIAATDKGTYANLALVSAYIRNQDYARALKAIDAIEAKLPDKPLAASLRGRVQLMRKDVAEARRSFERALVIDPVFIPAASSLAMLDLADNKPEMAKKRFETVLAADPKNLQALLAIAGMRAKAGASSEEMAGLLANAVKLNPAEVGPRVLLVDHFLAHKDTKAGLAAAQDAVAGFPNSPQALDALGRAQMASGDTNQAIASFGKLASLDPRSPAAHLRLAAVHIGAKNTDAAIQSVKRALAITPNMLAAQQLLVTLEIEAKRPQEALLVARTVQKQRPGEGVGYMLEAAVEVARRNLPAAAEIYRTVLKKFPATAAAVKLHSVLVASEKGAEADKFASTWIAAHPQDAGFLFYLGEISLVKGNYAAAESQFQGVLRIAPGDAAALNNVAWIMTKLNKPGAVEYAQKASSLVPQAPAFLDTLASAFAAEKQVEKAVDAQQKAVALAPNNLVFRLNLAKIYLQAGAKAKARSELETLSKAGDNSAVKAEVESLLTKL